MKKHAPNRTNSGLLKEVDAVFLHDFITKECEIHGTDLKGKSGMGNDWEKGFIAGMIHSQKLLGICRRLPE